MKRISVRDENLQTKLEKWWKEDALDAAQSGFYEEDFTTTLRGGTSIEFDQKYDYEYIITDIEDIQSANIEDINNLDDLRELLHIISDDCSAPKKRKCPELCVDLDITHCIYWGRCIFPNKAALKHTLFIKLVMVPRD